MTQSFAKPVVFGLVMGAMMLLMLHNALSGEGTLGLFSLMLFVAAHVLVAGLLIALSICASRLSPRLRSWLDRLHRPTARHLLSMFGTALLTLLASHLILHGGL